MSKKASGKAPAAQKAAASRGSRAKRQEAETASSEKALTSEKQTSLYEKAMKQFHAGKFAAARDVFTDAAKGPIREMAHSARVHRMVCERRLEAGEPQLPTPEDRYNYAIALINRGEPRQALRHLEEALRDMPDADHLHYAMAICLGLVGEMDRAASELRRAIALQPRNRTAARNDPDFQPFASAPQIKSILHPETAG